MFKIILEFFGIYAKEVKSEITKVVEEVKTEVKAEVAKVKEAVKCGCGRSPTGFCMGLHSLSNEVWALHELNPSKVVAAIAAAETAVKEEVTKKIAKAAKSLKNAEAKVETAVKSATSKKKNASKK
jgi:hypothetical protein